MTIFKAHHLAVLALAGLTFACGQTNEHISSTKITNGTTIPETTYPYVANIDGCTGTWVRHDMLLTAAHCVDGGRTSVRVGGRWISSVRVEINPEYTSGVSRDDVALVWFPANSSAMTLDVCPFRAAIGDEFDIVGYGNNDMSARTGYGTKRLGRNRITEITTEGFLKFVGQRTPTDNSGNNAGAGSGDSGGPLLLSNCIMGVTSGVSNDGQPAMISYYVDLHNPSASRFLSSHGITVHNGTKTRISLKTRADHYINSNDSKGAFSAVPRFHPVWGTSDEIFELIDLDGGVINSNDKVMIRTRANYYMNTFDSKGDVMAKATFNANVAQSDEIYTLIKEGNKVSFRTRTGCYLNSFDSRGKLSCQPNRHPDWGVSDEIFELQVR